MSSLSSALPTFFDLKLQLFPTQVSHYTGALPRVETCCVHVIGEWAQMFSLEMFKRQTNAHQRHNINHERRQKFHIISNIVYMNAILSLVTELRIS